LFLDSEHREVQDCELNVGYLMILVAHVMRWVRHVALMEERRGVYRGLVGKPEGKRPLGFFLMF